MRWPEPRQGQYRARRGFLFIPKTIGYETRWLEWAAWIERYGCNDYWVPEAWVPEAWVYRPIDFEAWVFRREAEEEAHLEDFIREETRDLRRETS